MSDRVAQAQLHDRPIKALQSLIHQTTIFQPQCRPEMSL